MEFMASQAIYLQIADQICEHILSGKWKEGERIPSVREMGESVQVNPNTVMRSFAYLQEQNIIYNQRGIGYFVAEGAQRRTLELKKNTFVARELPQLFRTMDLLRISCEDLRELYERRKKRAV
jgi:GntR family transcriptional regulator